MALHVKNLIGYLGFCLGILSLAFQWVEYRRNREIQAIQAAFNLHIVHYAEEIERNHKCMR